MSNDRWPVQEVTADAWNAAEKYEPDWLVPGKFIRGVYHELVGDLGAGKTMVEHGIIVKEGFPLGYRFGRMDLENDFHAVVLPRLRQLGATYEQVRDQYVFMPNWRITPGDMDEVVQRLDDLDLDYLGMDALLDMYQAWGADTIDNKDAADWSKEVAERIVRELDLALVVHDHMGRQVKTRAIGATGKGINIGATWLVRVDQPFSVHEVGQVTLERGEKNRYGVLPREHVYRVGGNGDGAIVFEPLAGEEKRDIERAHEHAVMKLLRVEPQSRRKLETARKNNRHLLMSQKELRAAIDRLVEEGFVEERGSSRNTTLHVREGDGADPAPIRVATRPRRRSRNAKAVSRRKRPTRTNAKGGESG